MHAIATIQEATVQRIADIARDGFVARGSELLIVPFGRATTYPCDHDALHGKGTCRLVDLDGEIHDLCLACVVPCIELRLAFEDTEVYVEVRR